jgi:poly-gamma-glutamate capsule biosynthesis protein CapA/YwtB (metallophosphatase superfamily)
MKKIFALVAIVIVAFLFKSLKRTELIKFEEVGDKEIKIMLLGDIMLGRTVNVRSLEKENPKYPFEKVADKLASADIVFANLESPIVQKCPKIYSGFVFCGDPQMVAGLSHAGIDVVSLANNHINNFGKRGVEDTKKYLDEAGIKWVTPEKLEIIEKGSTKFGFLGFEWVDSGPTENELRFIDDSNEKVDILIVAPHWGWEYQASANKNQEKWATQLVEAGADVIAGSHPHWVQNNVKINDKPVYYSLGNFVFDQMWSENTRKGIAVELTFENKKLVNEVKLPIYMREWAQPEWVE